MDRGRLHHTEAAELEPKPDHRIPIWLGTFGDRALSVTGRLADGWIPSLGHAPPERIPAMRERIAAGARAAGRDPEEITSVYNLEIRVESSAQTQPSVVSGAPMAIAEQLVGFVELGFTGFNFMPVGDGRADQVELVAKEVIPSLRDNL